MTHHAILGIGSNVPPRLDNIGRALSLLALYGDVMDVSEPVESADDTGLGAPYINVAVAFRTCLDSARLAEHISGIEHALGRTDDSKAAGTMPLDIDTVVWDGNIVSTYDYNRPYFITCRQSLDRSCEVATAKP